MERQKRTCTLLIKNCNVILPDCSVLEGAFVAINNDTIIEIGQNNLACEIFSADEIIDAKGKIAMPGMIDCHTHISQQFLRGGVVDERPIVWIRILTPYEATLNEEDRYHASRLACLQMIKAGITTFADSGIGDMTEAIRAVQETGMRASITRVTRDGGDFIPPAFKSSAEKAVRKNEELYRQYHGSGNGRVSIWFSVTSPMTTSKKLATLVAEAAKEYQTGIHIHLAEHLDEVKHCIAQFGMRSAEYLDSCGLLGSNLLAAHCIHISDFDVRLLAEQKVNIIHCPTSNLTSHGFPKLLAERAAGINIGLGNDGAGTANLDLLFQAQLLKYVTQAAYGLPIFEPVTLPLTEAFNMMTINGAKALMLGDQIGSLEVGKKADIILLDINQPQFVPTKNLFNTFMMVGAGRDVTDVIIDGQVILKNRGFVSIDEEEVVNLASAQFKKIWS